MSPKTPSKFTKNTTKRRNHKKRSTMRKRKPEQQFVIHKMLEMINVVKLYHWQTQSYSVHKATDKLYEKLDGNIDRFVEVYLGKEGSRIKKWDNEMSIIQYNRKKDFKSRMFEYREFLTDLSNKFDEKKDSDLLSIRDEILADINQFLYLFSFNK
jgi:DNA-binding ferritin-like protein